MAWNIFGRKGRPGVAVTEAESGTSGHAKEGDALRDWWEQGRYALIVRKKDRFKAQPGQGVSLNTPLAVVSAVQPPPPCWRAASQSSSVLRRRVQA